MNGAVTHRSFSKRAPTLPLVMLASLCAALPMVAPAQAQSSSSEEGWPVGLITHAYLIELDTFNAQTLRDVKERGAEQVVVELREGVSAARYGAIQQLADQFDLPLLGWVEIARNPKLATDHPHLMATMGMHGHWREQFPDFPTDTEDALIKIYPWVPIWYEEAFDLHLQRLETLVSRVPEGMVGILLNNVQGPPSACGCGNLSCRWTVDYRTGSTATKLEDPRTPARFLREAKERLNGVPVLPVWYIECEEIDQHWHSQSTGHSGPVHCVGYKHSACWPNFVRQLDPVLAQTQGTLAVAGFYKALDRDLPQYESTAGWVAADSYPT